MTKTRYRVITKVFCPNCSHLARTRQPIDPKCSSCEFVKYNNVLDLLSFTASLNKNYPNWVYFNVYEYKKGEKGRFLDNFIKGKKEPSTKTI